MIWFAVATFAPVVVLALACLFGGWWSVAALLTMTFVVFLADRVTHHLAPNPEKDGLNVSIALALAHFPLLGLGVWALGAGAHLTVLDQALLFLALGMYLGQVSNSNAHELIHARSKPARKLGLMVYCSMLHGHHVSAHLRVHHIHAGTDEDPNSARAGEGFYAFALRAFLGEFMAGLRADNHYRSRSVKSLSYWSHPYLQYLAGAALALAWALALAGWVGVLWLLAIACYTQFQLALSDYVQHYGLRRRVDRHGRLEPMGPRHSWNARQWYSGAMMLNAPRHSDHHAHPGKTYPALEIEDDMPLLPRSLPVMGVVALIPPLWRKVMDPRLARWQSAA